MPNVILKYKTDGPGLLYSYIGDHAVNNQYAIPGLTGCMGLICVPGPGSPQPSKVFLAHSKVDPHFDLKIKFEAYLNDHGVTGNGTVIRTKYLKEFKQDEWIRKRLPGVTFERHANLASDLAFPQPVIAKQYTPDECNVGVESGGAKVNHAKYKFKYNKKIFEGKEALYAASNACACCAVKWGLTKWRYRCKECNGIVCSTCSRKDRQDGLGARICDKCAGAVKNGGETWLDAQK